MNVLGGRRFQPHLWPSLFSLVGIAVLIWLGTWQVQRLHWKEALIADLQARTSEAPMALPKSIVDPVALEFRPVRLTGRFLHDKEMYLTGRTYKRTVGLHVITPMALDDGRTVLVDRGWVPPQRKAPDTRAAGQVEGEITLVGPLRRGGWRGLDLFRPENQPEDNLWVWLDLPAMAAHADLAGAVTEIYVAAGPADTPGGVPIGGQTPVTLRNDHLQYALTWYALAVALLVIYILHQSRPIEDRDADHRL